MGKVPRVIKIILKYISVSKSINCLSITLWCGTVRDQFRLSPDATSRPPSYRPSHPQNPPTPTEIRRLSPGHSLRLRTPKDSSQELFPDLLLWSTSNHTVSAHSPYGPQDRSLHPLSQSSPSGKDRQVGLVYPIRKYLNLSKRHNFLFF